MVEVTAHRLSHRRGHQSPPWINRLLQTRIISLIIFVITLFYIICRLIAMTNNIHAQQIQQTNNNSNRLGSSLSNKKDESQILASRKSYPKDAQMGTKQMDNIMSILPTSGNLLVWGLGNDSPYWHNSTSGKVVFLEDDDPTTKEGILWYDHITYQYPYLNAYKVHYTTKNNDSNFEKYMNDPWSSDLVINNFPKEVMETKWDVILVDAPLGWGTGNWGTGPGRYQSIYMTLQIARKQLIEGIVSTVHVFVDDYERRVENQYAQKVFGNKKPYRIIDREEGISNANRQAHFIFHKDHCIISNPTSCGNEDSRREVQAIDRRQQQYDNGVDEKKKSDIHRIEDEKLKTNWIILLTINTGFYDFFLNWLAHYKKLNVDTDQEVIVIAEDDIVFDRLLNDRRIPTSFKIERSKFKSSDTEALDYESDSYKKMVSNRASILLDKLEDRLDIVYSDVDTVWLANPLQYVDDEFNKDSQVDVVAQTDDLPHEGTYPYYCTGFMAIKYNKRSIQFMKDWEVSLLEKPKLNQPIFNELLKGGKSDMKAQPLPPVQFPHGGSYYHGTESDRQKAVIFHNNYVIGHDVKKKRFRDYGLWLVNEEGKTPSAPLATLATTLLPTEAGAQKYRIQLNTLRALSYLRPDIDTVVFSNNNASSSGVVDEMCKKLGIRVINDFESNPHNTPYVRSIFEYLEGDVSISSPFIGYVNADIIFSSTLNNTLNAILQYQRVRRKVHRQVLIIGQRTNVQVNFTSTEDHEEELKEEQEYEKFVVKAQRHGDLFGTDAQDFFIATQGAFNWSDIPDFVVGRPGYDNWLVDYIFHKHKTHSLIDITNTTLAIHQTGQDGNKAGFVEREDKEWNSNLIGEWENVDHGFIHCAHHETVWEKKKSRKKKVILNERISSCSDGIDDDDNSNDGNTK